VLKQKGKAEESSQSFQTANLDSKMSEVGIEGIGTFGKNGKFMLKDKKEQDKLMRIFGRLAQNRSTYVKDKIKENNYRKIQPTETYMPQINKRSKAIEQKKMELFGKKVPRHEILLEKGRMYESNKEQRVIRAMEGELMEDQMESIDDQPSPENTDNRQNELREIIHDIKQNEYQQEEYPMPLEYEGRMPEGQEIHQDPEIIDETDQNQIDNFEDDDPQIEEEIGNDQQTPEIDQDLMDKIITPDREEYKEVREEEVEESPDAEERKLHGSASKTDLRDIEAEGDQEGSSAHKQDDNSIKVYVK
jgi:hypothetical protein